MADDPASILLFRAGCPDCGERAVALPAPLPEIPDDFDWEARDYDSFRLFLMEELAHRFTERRRWTVADMEVVIVEVLAAALDRLSHALDTIQAERFLETARRPQSLRRLLNLIGYDAVREAAVPSTFAAASMADATNGAPRPETETERLERYWRLHPAAMEEARLAGPQRIREQRRMVTLADHEVRVTAHPLVRRARARLVWTGAWNTILVAVLIADDRGVDVPLHQGPALPARTRPSKLKPEIWADILAFQDSHGLPLPPTDDRLTPRALIGILVERMRMAGSEVMLEPAREVPITFTLSVKAKPAYYRSELRNALVQALSADSGGLFEPGRLGFGDDVYASDIVDAAMGVEGVATACLTRFRRIDGRYGDQSGSGFIAMADDEIAICLNRIDAPDRGLFRILVNDGMAG